MAICITSDTISTDAGSVCQTPSGVSFNGSIAAHAFCDARGFQGSNYGFQSGGSEPAISTNIQRFSLPSGSPATDVSELAIRSAKHVGMSSFTCGFTVGGYTGPPEAYTRIQYFPFAVVTPGTDASDLSPSYASEYNAGISDTFGDCGYIVGTCLSPETTANAFPFASLTPITVGTGITLGPGQATTGISGTTHGYVAGRSDPFTAEIIDRFPFAGSFSSTDVGNLATFVRDAAGASSRENGYVMGGSCLGGATAPTSPILKTIQKFALASSANASTVGSLGVGVYRNSGVSGTEYGFSVSGYGSPAPPFPASGDRQRTIQRFPFASDSPSVSVGLTSVKNYEAAGHQY